MIQTSTLKTRLRSLVTTEDTNPVKGPAVTAPRAIKDTNDTDMI